MSLTSMPGAESNPDSHIEISGSFFLNDEEFALPVKCIHEVVNGPDSLTSVPLAPAYLKGIFNLRGTIIPVVDLKSLLNLPSIPTVLATQKIAIVEIGEVRLGLLFDRTGEIFRNRPEERCDFHYASGAHSSPVIASVIKLNAGKRIVPILAPETILRLEGVPQGDGKIISKSKKQANRKQCISFVVHGHRFAFGIDVINEIIKVPKITNSALGSANCLGMIELRSQVLPVVDFASLLGYRTPRPINEVSSEHRVLVMKMGEQKLGLLIDSVDSIIPYNHDELLTVPAFNNRMRKLFSGCISQAGLGDVLLFNQHELFAIDEIESIIQGNSKLYQTLVDDASIKKLKGAKKSYIVFKVQNLFALRIDEVKELIEEPKELLHPPGMVDFVKGVLHLRKKMVVILDTRALYGIPPQTGTESSKILIFEKDGNSYGMTVDSVQSITSFSEEDALKLPTIFYQSEGQRYQEDVRYAITIEYQQRQTSLLVLNLDSLVARIVSATKQAPIKTTA